MVSIAIRHFDLRMHAGAAFAVLLGLSAPGLCAEEAVKVERGTAGLVETPFEAVNHSAGPIECQASIAHWYSAPVGAAGPGGSVRAALWSDPASGAVYLLNERKERMPVQALFCGVGGRAASTRADILLARRAGAAEPAVRLDCTGGAGGDRLACERSAP